jgi:arylsulfatase A-like enzyme
MLAYYPGKVPHATTDHQVVLYDFLATACDLAGIEQPENDGISFVPLLEGTPEKQKAHEYMYWGGGSYMPQAQAVRKGDWFGMRLNPQEPLQLWNVENDVGCEHDIAGEHPDLVKEILEIMEREHVDSEWYPNPGETEEQIQAKREKALRMKSMQNPTRGNSVFPEQAGIQND